MADMGGGAAAPTPAPSTHYPATVSSSAATPAVAPTPTPFDALPRDRELLAGAGEEPSADAAADKEVEREGAALAAIIGAEHDEYVPG
ncbi:hypothetical protein OsJ_21172 [Oryza sativa Japonica Group]|uniref:Uncharacterized protein n=1 Tax=Oryza sativa subsp. japonica TaxID=39947 RepID=B9FT04_ORYSJ|nr:hypothetical protein OsJ_21172 [Oryza sativa Japonica Group]